MNDFQGWLDVFLSEHEVDMEETFEVEGPSGVNDMPYAAVVLAMKRTGTEEQKKLQDLFVRADLVNADVRAILRFLAQAIAV